MDRVKAVKVLKPLVAMYVDHASISMKEEDDNIAEALEMAVEALDVPDTNVGDMISRKAAIDAVIDEFKRSPTPAIRAKLRLEALPPAQPEQRWIPCSERLPEKNCRCLTTNKAWGSFEVDWNAWIDGRWLYPNEKPIAWMPLPEPYGGGEKDDR